MAIEQGTAAASTQALAFANGLRKNMTIAGRRWAHWPGGAEHLATVIACVDRVSRRLRASDGPDATDVAACISDLRAILEWTTYQSSALATARAIFVARRTRTIVERLQLVVHPRESLSVLAESESALIENVRLRNGYMADIARRYPHLGLPPALVDAQHLVPAPAAVSSRLALIQRLKNGAKAKP